ncbi:MAG: fibronectin type III domain-containing protein [Treponema sp.]|nr:fibronectin type III domain-containing protein [Candidatus Treponema equifaecale]
MGFLKNSLSLLSVLLISNFAFAGQRSLVLGGEQGWKNIAQMQGLALGKGQFGYDSIELSTFIAETTPSTDMLLSFDGSTFSDLAGNYKVVSNKLVPTSEAIKGNGAALSRGLGDGITLLGNNNALFGKEGLAGSFTIEFWLCPSIAENGETILSWRSSLNSANYSEYQMISASIFNNHLQWTFNNVFDRFKAAKVVLEGWSTMVPQKWSRHTISFNDETGLLEYLVDGRSEAIVYVTRSGHENGTVCNPVLGTRASIELCGEYAGKIDNFRIERAAYRRDSRNVFATGNEKYQLGGGKFVTEPILVSQAAVMNQVDALISVPVQSDVKFFARSGDNCYGWTDTYPEWKEITLGEKIEGISGLYFQLSGELLPDGGACSTPSISELTIKYEEQDEPLPPFTVRADAGDGSVTVSWSYSVDESAGGYMVYYGNRPGEYLGRVAYEGASPVKVGNQTSVTLTGLQNGTIYYFAVSSYSKVDGRIRGTLSKEVFARPSSRLAQLAH